MKIAICDDDVLWSIKAEKIIRSFDQRVKLELDIITFNDAKDLFFYAGEPIDVIFLDIEIKDTSGIDVAKKLNIKWPHCQIVYLTNYIYYAIDVYQTQHSFFMVKNQFEEKLGEIMSKVIHQMEENSAKIHLQIIGKKAIVVRQKEISYLERDKRHTKIYTNWGCYEVKDKLGELLDHLIKIDFSRCHNSFVVNFQNVRELQNDHYVMEDGKKIIISGGYAKQTKMDFMKWASFRMS